MINEEIYNKARGAPTEFLGAREAGNEQIGVRTPEEKNNHPTKSGFL